MATIDRKAEEKRKSDICYSCEHAIQHEHVNDKYCVLTKHCCTKVIQEKVTQPIGECPLNKW